MYADAGPEPRTEPGTLNPEPLEILTRFASQRLEALTAIKAARSLTGKADAAAPRAGQNDDSADEHAAARRYARLLVSEIKLYHEPQVAEGRRERDLATRLGGEIARVRTLYEQRVPPEVRQSTDYVHEELIRTLADGDASLLDAKTRQGPAESGHQMKAHDSMTRSAVSRVSPLLSAGGVRTASPSAQQPVGATSPAVVVLRPTDHPPLPDDPSQFWMTPTKANTTRTAALNAFASAVKLEVDGQFAKALPILSQPLLRTHPLGEYVQYYKGLAELSVGRTTDARSTFQALIASGPAGYLWEAAALREAESDEALGDHGAALAIYERLSKTKDRGA